MIAIGVLSINLFGCGKSEEDLKECQEKGILYTYNEETSECDATRFDDPPPLATLKEECESKGEDFSFDEETGECLTVRSTPFPPPEETNE